MVRQEKGRALVTSSCEKRSGLGRRKSGRELESKFHQIDPWDMYVRQDKEE